MGYFFQKSTLLLSFVFVFGLNPHTFAQADFTDWYRECDFREMTTHPSGDFYANIQWLNNPDYRNGICRLNASGYMLWSRIADWPAAGGTASLDIQPSADGNIYSVILRDSAGITSNLLMKMDTLGNLLWSRQSLGYRKLVPTADGGVLVFGSAFSGISASRYDANGNLLWAKGYRGPVNTSISYSRASEATGGFLLSGYYRPVAGQFNDQDAFLIKIDTLGNQVWAGKYGVGNYSEVFGDMYELGDGSFMVYTYAKDTLLASNVFGDCGWTRISSTGGLLWSKLLSSVHTITNSLRSHAGNFILMGYPQPSCTPPIRITECDSAGNLVGAWLCPTGTLCRAIATTDSHYVHYTFEVSGSVFGGVFSRNPHIAEYHCATWTPLNTNYTDYNMPLANFTTQNASLTGVSNPVVPWIPGPAFSDSMICGTCDLGAGFSYSQSSGNFTFTDLSVGNPLSWNWTFGDGNSSTAQHPVHNYSSPGTYQVCLIVSSSCGTDSVCQTVNILTDIAQPAESAFFIFPNPAGKEFFLRVPHEFSNPAFSLIAPDGRIVKFTSLESQQGSNEFHFKTESLASGIYFLEIKTGSEIFFRKVVIQN